jgi:hypothetical protein
LEATNAEQLDALQNQLKAAYAANPNLEGVRLIALLAAGRTGEEHPSKPGAQPSRQQSTPAGAGAGPTASPTVPAAEPKNHRQPGKVAGPQAPGRARPAPNAKATEAPDSASELAESPSEDDAAEEAAWQQLDEEDGEEESLSLDAGWRLAGDSDEDTDAEELAQMRSELKAALAEVPSTCTPCFGPMLFFFFCWVRFAC